ncbi:prenyltransferase/squalene oxidase repeat-containing protein, partial [Streptomyces sp. UNOC14_S4]|uniref:prenyltransferase/squalene oxidase repeat-containing protein n=1 Tax=Streptomyces sp. UNOC14_S4 TaxID=2872340 RepID=UPI0023AF766B
LEVCYRRVEHEQRTTRDMGLTPGSALLNVLVLHDRRPGSLAVRRAFEAQAYWRWSDVDGVRFASGRTQTRDTAFAVEALLTDDRIVTQAALVRATAFLWGARLTEEVPDPEVTARAAARGGWCASEGGHRWPVSDCTAEALTALLYAAPRGDRHREAAVREAAAFLLRRQNRDGGFGAYERRRAPRLLDALNPTEMFTDCVVEGSYVESTGSALVGLAAACGAVEPPVVRRARRRAVRFLLRHQAADGSWPAARGVHRLHGTWCAVRGLRAAGLPTTHDALRRAAEWLRSVQRADGGWGEHHSGCLEGRYVEHSESQPVSTAWAVLALLDAEGPQDAAAERGVRWLCRWQGEDGTWEQSAVTGVLFGTVMLDLRLSARHFPAWALGRWLREAGPSIRP